MKQIFIIFSFLFLVHGYLRRKCKQYDETLAKEYWCYNTVAYCSPAKLQTWDVSEVSRLYPGVTDIHIYQNQQTDNLAYLAYNPSTTTIFLSFRGTLLFSYKNWVKQNFNFFQTTFDDCADCKVHRGFLDAYKNLDTTTMMNDLKSLKGKYPDAKVVITGHSLGGAMANFGFLDACNAVEKVNLLITFGSPRVGDSKFVSHMQNKKCGGAEKIRVVNNRDPVPHVPLKSMGFQHGQSEIFYKKGALKYNYCQDTESNDCSDSLYLDVEISDHLGYLGFSQATQKDSCQ